MSFKLRHGKHSYVKGKQNRTYHSKCSIENILLLTTKLHIIPPAILAQKTQPLIWKPKHMFRTSFRGRKVPRGCWNLFWWWWWWWRFFLLSHLLDHPCFDLRVRRISTTYMGLFIVVGARIQCPRTQLQPATNANGNMFAILINSFRNHLFLPLCSHTLGVKWPLLWFTSMDF